MDLGHAFGYKRQEVINIPLSVIFATLAVIRAFASDSSVECARKRWNAGSKHVDNGPNDPLGCQSSGPIAETKGPVEVDLASPTDSKEDRGDWIEDEPPIPARKIQFENEDALAGVLPPGSLDSSHDGLRRGEGKLPIFATRGVMLD